MRRILTVILFVLVVLGQANLSNGAGFLIYEHGAAAMAMAGAFISVANNPSAIWHNPAGIAFLKGTQFSLGTTLIWPKNSLELMNWPVPTQRNWEGLAQVFYPSNFYLTQSVGDKVTLGFGFFTPYGLGAKWPEENPLRYLGYEDDMKTFFFNPTVAFKLTDQVSIGVGVSYIYSTVMFKLVEFADLGVYGQYDVPGTMEGNGKSWSWNAGLLYRGEKFSFGLNYRSAFDIDFAGDLELDTSAVPAPLRPFIPTSAEGETTFRFPHILGVGLSYYVTEKLLLTGDIHYVLWNRFDKYVVTFDNPDIEELEVLEDWENSFTFRGGLQYMVSEKFALRGGILYDQTPQPLESMDPLLPDADRVAFTLGFGYRFGNFVLDAAYQGEMFSDRTAPNRDIYKMGSINLGEGTYKTSAHLLGISLSFVF